MREKSYRDMNRKINILGFSLALMGTIWGSFVIWSSQSSTVLVVGRVLAECSLEIDHVESAFPIDMNIGSGGNLVIASITEHYNASGGYDIDVQSANGGMEHESDTLDVHDYSVVYDGGAPVSASTIQASATEIVSAAPSPTGASGLSLIHI